MLISVCWLQVAKSGAGWMVQGFLLLFGSLVGALPYMALCYIITTYAWTQATLSLARLMAHKHPSPEFVPHPPPPTPPPPVLITPVPETTVVVAPQPILVAAVAGEAATASESLADEELVAACMPAAAVHDPATADLLMQGVEMDVLQANEVSSSFEFLKHMVHSQAQQAACLSASMAVGDCKYTLLVLHAVNGSTF